MDNSHRNDQKCNDSVDSAALESYPPDMTAEVKLALEKEIAQFDKKYTLDVIEQESKSKPDTACYSDMQDSEKFGSVEADPDLLSEEEAVNLQKPSLPRGFAQAKEEIDCILSPRELQVWRLAMRQGLAHKKVASLLHISIRSVTTYLQRAKTKVQEHFKQGDNDEG